MSTFEQNEKAEKTEKRRLLDETGKRILKEVGPLWGWILLCSLLCLLLIGCAIAEPELLGSLIDRLYDWATTDSTGLVQSLLPGLGILLGVYALEGILSYSKYFLLTNIVSRFFCADMRIRISEKLSRLPVSFVDKTPAGDVIDRMMEDVGTTADSIFGLVDILISGFLQMILIIVILFVTDWRMAIPVVLLFPLSLLLAARMATLGEKHWDKHFDLGGKLTALAEESFTNYPTTKAFCREEEMQEKYDALSKKHEHNGILGHFLSSIVQPVIAFVNALAYIAVTVLGGWLVLKKLVPIGTVVTIILFARRLSSPLERVAFGLGYVQQVKGAAKRVFTLLDLPEEKDPAGIVETPTRGHVVFEHVDFSYDPDKPLIRDLCLEVRPGQKVAIVGPTGAGKTTIVNLLMRFYDIQSGRVLIDGRDASELSRAESRNLFAMVLQDTWLFKGKPRRQPGGDRAGLRPGLLRPLYPPTAPGLRHRDLRGQHRRLLGTEAAADHCPGHAGGPPPADPGRGHLQRGHPDRAADPEGHGPAHGRPHLLCHRPPAVHHRGRGPDPGPPGRPHCRAGDPPVPAGTGRLLQGAV